MITLYILLFIVWYLSGFFSFVYWWTMDFDLKIDTIIVPIMLGFLGLGLLDGLFIVLMSTKFYLKRGNGNKVYQASMD